MPSSVVYALEALTELVALKLLYSDDPKPKKRGTYNQSHGRTFAEAKQHWTSSFPRSYPHPQSC